MVPVPVPAPGEVATLADRVRAFLTAAKAPATRRAYASDWRHFTTWCVARGMPSLPATPETVALYLAALAADHKPATLRRKLTSIGKAHQAAGHPSPSTLQHAVVSETLKGIRRMLGTDQPGKTPLLTSDIKKLLAALPDNRAGCRDRALLLIGFAGGFRRSELAAIDVEHVSETTDGLVIRIPRSKTDPEGQGARWPSRLPLRPRPARSAAAGPGSPPPALPAGPSSAPSTATAAPDASIRGPSPASSSARPVQRASMPRSTPATACEPAFVPRRI